MHDDTSAIPATTQATLDDCHRTRRDGGDNEIATYGTLATLARKLGYTEGMKLLLETLAEEKATDQRLTLLAKQQLSEEETGK